MMSKRFSPTLSVGFRSRVRALSLQRQIAWFCMAICLAAFTSKALAGGGELERSLLKCSLIVENGQRLECVDRVIRSIDRSDDTVSQQQAISERTQEGTTNNTTLGQKYLPKPKSVNTKKAYLYVLISVDRDKKKRWVFSFENGQVWRQVEARYFSKPKELPTRVDISTGVFGSFDLRVEGRDGTVKVKRLR